jgi:hypothetical protein
MFHITQSSEMEKKMPVAAGQPASLDWTPAGM